MDWQVAIDIKSWNYLDETVLNILGFAQDNKNIYVLFDERLFNETLPYDKLWLIEKSLSNINKKTYELVSDTKNITVEPELMAKLSDSEKRELKSMAYKQFETKEPPHKIYALASSRSNTTQMKIKCEEKEKSISIMSPDNIAINNFIESKNPKLKQEGDFDHRVKHNPHTTRNIGDNEASKFSAWNPNDDSYAKSLLLKAWNDTKSSELYPDKMFVWDTKNKTYVKFRLSINNEYHGYDVTFNEVTDKVKRRYNHRKK